MRNQLSFHYLFLALLSVFLLTSFTQQLYAQDADKNSVRLTVNYTKIMDGEAYLDIKARSRINKVNTVVPNIELGLINELEDERNQVLRKRFLEEEIKNNPNEELVKELETLENVNEKSDEMYREVAYGYRSMSTRKNSLSEERDSIVKYLEEIDDELIDLGEDISESKYATAKEEYIHSDFDKQIEIIQKVFPDEEVGEYGVSWSRLTPESKKKIGKGLGFKKSEIE